MPYEPQKSSNKSTTQPSKLLAALRMPKSTTCCQLASHSGSLMLPAQKARSASQRTPTTCTARRCGLRKPRHALFQKHAASDGQLELRFPRRLQKLPSRARASCPLSLSRFAAMTAARPSLPGFARADHHDSVLRRCKIRALIRHENVRKPLDSRN
jgi:hypothetical protein